MGLSGKAGFVVEPFSLVEWRTAPDLDAILSTMSRSRRLDVAKNCAARFEPVAVRKALLKRARVLVIAQLWQKEQSAAQSWCLATPQHGLLPGLYSGQAAVCRARQLWLVVELPFGSAGRARPHSRLLARWRARRRLFPSSSRM
jgi:hypothetical protein